MVAVVHFSRESSIPLEPKLSYSMNKIPHSESYIICYVRLTVKFLVLSFVVFADTKYTMTC